MPQAGGGAPVRARINRQPLLKVKRQLKVLREHAEELGRMPAGYPLHVRVVMSAVSALLPWYTRSLRQFGAQTTQTVEEIAGCLEELVKQQESLADFQSGPDSRLG